MTRIILAAIVLVLASPAFAQTAAQVDARIEQMRQAARLRAWEAWYGYRAPTRTKPLVWSTHVRTPTGSYSYRRVQY